MDTITLSIAKKYTKTSIAGLWDKWNTSTTYAAGQIVLYNSIPYQKKSGASTQGTFVPAEWEQINISDELEKIALKENTSNKVSTWSASPDNNHYPSEKLVKDNLDAKQTSNLVTAWQTTPDNAHYPSELLVVNSLKSKQDILSTAGYHNSIVRGADVTQYFTDGTLWQRINGTNGFAPFEDLYLGDYINMGVRVSCQESDQGTSYGNIGSQYITIAGFNTHSGNGDNIDVNYNHLCMVPGKFKSGDFHFGKHRMNASNVTTGGYAGSVMHTSVLGAVATSGKTYANGGTINEQLYNIFGSHLKTTRELLSNAINNSGYNRLGSNSGCSNGYAWTSCQAVLMSEVECYGSIVWSSSGYDTGNANNQLPLFKAEKRCMNNRSSYYWLKDVVGASWFAYCYGNGYATYYDASHTSICVRPRFLIS